jgi:glyoxylase-like metal-dependent hydrolase (beta-lactamase superfamily II)
VAVVTTRAVLAVAALALASAGCRAPRPASAAAAGTYEVYAVRFGRFPGYPLRSLVVGADTARRQELAMTVWLLKGNGRTVLVDAGFYREKFLRRWNRMESFTRPAEKLAEVGVRPEDVTDVVVSHVHWDHVDGLDLLPKARVWIQRAEYDYYVNADGTPKAAAIDSADAAMLAALRAAGRVELVGGDSVEILPGVTVYTGGKHTWASQYVGVRTRAGTAIIASDNAYLYENLDRRRPIAQSLDTLSNLAAQDRMRRLASHPRLVVPGHDPLVLARFPRVTADVVRIE